MYKRKTKDIYEIWTNYGYGWECETRATTYAEAKQLYKDYLYNTDARVKIEKRRERLEEAK